MQSHCRSNRYPDFYDRQQKLSPAGSFALLVQVTSYVSQTDQVLNYPSPGNAQFIEPDIKAAAVGLEDLRVNLDLDQQAMIREVVLTGLLLDSQNPDFKIDKTLPGISGDQNLCTALQRTINSGSQVIKGRQHIDGMLTVGDIMLFGRAQDTFFKLLLGNLASLVVERADLDAIRPLPPSLLPDLRYMLNAVQRAIRQQSHQ